MYIMILLYSYPFYKWTRGISRLLSRTIITSIISQAWRHVGIQRMQWKFYLQSSFPCTTCFTFINKFLKYDICMYLQQEIGLFDIFNIITLPYFQHHNWSSRAFYIMEHNCDSLLSLWCYSLQCCVFTCFELVAID